MLVLFPLFGRIGDTIDAWARQNELCIDSE